MTEQDFLKNKGYGHWVPDSIYGREGVVYCCRKVPETDRQQYVIKKWPAINTSIPQHCMPTYELEMTYETRGEIWATTKFYGLSYTQLCANLDRLEECLKQSLLYMDANPLHYRFDGED